MTIFLAEVTGYDPVAGTEVVLHFSSQAISPFRSGDGYRPDQFYDPRIVDITPFTKSMFGSGRTSGSTASGGGSLVLSNADNGLDAYHTWGFAGRKCELYVGEQEQDFANYALVLTATIEQPLYAFGGDSAATVTFKLRDKVRVLDVPIQENLYLGTNATTGVYEGTEDDLLDKPKPLCFGECLNITPVPCNTTLHHYQIHDGPIEAITTVYDAGEVVTYYTEDLANGYFTLTQPPAGAITCNVKGAKPSVYLSTVADIVQHIVETYGGIATGDIDTASITDLNTANSATVGIYITEDTTIIAVIDELLSSISGFWGFDGLSRFFVGRLAVPTGTSLATFTNTDLIDIKYIESGDEQGNIPIYKVQLGYKKIFTVQNDGDLAGIITPQRRLRLKKQYLTATRTDVTVKVVHLLAGVIKRDTLLITGAGTEANRLLTLYKTVRDFLAIVVEFNEANAALTLGSIITLQVNRIGLSAGKKFIITSATPYSPALNQIEFEVWG
ncbi:MAG: hypothetical protein EPN89_14770 [Methylovulum sp.]|nr:MAG: hypothetical protein EPN89_14770 [Methylovulum sp.]